MIELDLDEVLRDLLEGGELRLFQTLKPLKEAFGYQPVPADWRFRDGVATASHRIEFTQGGQSVAGWFVTRGGETKAAQSFPDGPYGVRIAGDAIRFEASVAAVALRTRAEMERAALREYIARTECRIAFGFRTTAQFDDHLQKLLDEDDRWLLGDLT